MKQSHSHKTPPPFSSHDERLAQMDSAHLKKLSEYAKELSECPPNKKLDTFLSIQARAGQEKISFSAAERELLLQILTEHMTPEEKQRVELIRRLASKLPSSH